MLTHKTRMRGTTSTNFYFFVALALLVCIILVWNKGTILVTGQAVPTLASYQLYTNPEYGYSFSYPQDWQVVDQSNKAVVSIATTLKEKNSAGGTNFSRRKLVDQPLQAVPSNGLSKLDVLAYELESPLTSQEFMLAKSSVAPEGVITQLTIAGLKAVRVDSSTALVLQHTNENVNYSSIFLSSGKTGYIIAGYASPQDLNAILQSFQIN